MTYCKKINPTVEQPQIYTDIYSSPTTALCKHFGYRYLLGSWNKSVSTLPHILRPQNMLNINSDILKQVTNTK